MQMLPQIAFLKLPMQCFAEKWWAHHHKLQFKERGFSGMIGLFRRGASLPCSELLASRGALARQRSIEVSVPLEHVASRGDCYPTSYQRGVRAGCNLLDFCARLCANSYFEDSGGFDFVGGLMVKGVVHHPGLRAATIRVALQIPLP
eukprot:2388790-Amphidinium_carterae.1